MLPKLHSTPAFPGLCQGDGGNPQDKANSADVLWEDLNMLLGGREETQNGFVECV